MTRPPDKPNGVIPYYCDPHCDVDMAGTITVSASTGVPAVSSWGLLAMVLVMNHTKFVARKEKLRRIER